MLEGTPKTGFAQPRRRITVEESIAESEQRREQNISDYFRDRKAEASEHNAEAERHRRQQRLEEFHEIGRGIGEALAASLPREVLTAIVKKAANLGD